MREKTETKFNVIIVILECKQWAQVDVCVCAGKRRQKLKRKTEWYYSRAQIEPFHFKWLTFFSLFRPLTRTLSHRESLPSLSTLFSILKSWASFSCCYSSTHSFVPSRSQMNFAASNVTTVTDMSSSCTSMHPVHGNIYSDDSREKMATKECTSSNGKQPWTTEKNAEKI